MRRDCKLIAVRTQMDYFFPTGKENVFSSQQSKHFIQTNNPEQFVYLPMLLKGTASSSRFLISFKYDNHIQVTKRVLGERNMSVMATQ